MIGDMSDTGNTIDSGRGRGSSARVSTLMKRASSLAEQGMFEEAIANVMEAMAISPHEARCSMQLASIYRAQNRIDPAIEAMQRAVELDPFDATVHEQLLRTLLDIGRYDEAITSSRRLLKYSPKNLIARDIMGIAFLQQGMIDNALSVTDELIRLDPVDASNHFKRAVLLQQKGEIRQAMQEFVRVIEMDPAGEMADDAREAIAALDSYQLRQILTLAVGDPIFRTKLNLDPDPALRERGFLLSPSGLTTLRQIDFNELPQEPQSLYYH